MNASADKDHTQRSGGGRTSRPRRVPCAVVLLALCVLFCLIGAAASAGAATPGYSAQTLLAQHALPVSSLSAAGVFTPFGISGTPRVVKRATPGKPVGLVYLAVARRGGETKVERQQFAGDRLAVREAATARALELLGAVLD